MTEIPGLDTTALVFMLLTSLPRTGNATYRFSGGRIAAVLSLLLPPFSSMRAVTKLNRLESRTAVVAQEAVLYHIAQTQALPEGKLPQRGG